MTKGSQPPAGTVRGVDLTFLPRVRETYREAATESIAVEAPLTIDIRDVGAFTIMASPDNARALAVGFALGEGIIDSLDRVEMLQECVDDPGVIRMAVSGYRTDGPVRNMAVMSSCGLCGSRSVDQLIDSLPRVGDTLRLESAVMDDALQAMKARQEIFSHTGGTHAAAIYDVRGEVRAMAEDIGRHSALDKAVGLAMLSGRPPAGLAVALSGRCSLEMIVKAARAGLELISAVSAPTSLAVQAAEATGLTLVNFVRQGRASVFTNPHRIV